MKIIKSFFSFLYNRKMLILYAYLVCMALSLIFCLKAGDDIQFHIQRLDSIIAEVKNSGISAFPIRIYHNALNGYGYASPMFYGDLFMWPFAILAVIFGIPTLYVHKLMVVSILAAIFFVAKYSFSMIFPDTEKRDIALVLYLINATIFFNSVGGGVGRQCAAIFVPLCICSFVKILYFDATDIKYSIILAVGMAGLIYSNTLESIIMCFSLLAMLVMGCKKLSVRKIEMLLLSALICVVLTAWYTLPMIEQMQSQTYFVSSDKITQEANDLHKYALPIAGMFLPQFVLKHFLHSGDFYPYFHELPYFVYFIIIFLIYKIKKSSVVLEKNKNLTYTLFILLLIYTYFQTKLFPHNLFKSIIGVLQFPSRTETNMICITAMLCVVLFDANDKWGKTIVSLVLIISSVFMLISASYMFHRKNYEYKHTTMCIAAAEYLPIEMYDPDVYNKFENDIKIRGDKIIVSDENVHVEFERNFDSSRLRFENNLSNAWFELPIVYYKGYEAKDSSENLCEIEKSKDGYIQIKPSENSGEIVIEYKGTVLQRISEFISLFGTFVMIILCIIFKRKKNLAK